MTRSMFNKKQMIFLGVLIVYIVIELLLLYILAIYYKGVYQVAFYVPLIVLQYGWYNLIFKKDNIKRYKIALWSLALLTISIPLIVSVTLPEYSYEKGKAIIEEQIDDENYLSIEYSKGKNSIPVINNPKQLFIANRNYYYRFSDGISNLYFVVDPVSGKAGRLDQEYWSEDP